MDSLRTPICSLSLLLAAGLAAGLQGCAFFSPKFSGDLPFELLTARECLFVNGVTRPELMRNDEWGIALKGRLLLAENESRLEDLRFVPDVRPNLQRAVLMEACREVAVLESAAFFRRLDRSSERNESFAGLLRNQKYRVQGRLTPEPFLVYKDRYGFVKAKVGKVPENYGKEDMRIPETD